MSAFLALVFHTGLAFQCFDAVWRTALAAKGLDTSLALRHSDGFPRHRLFD
jgi:hypothetical protein